MQHDSIALIISFKPVIRAALPTDRGGAGGRRGRARSRTRLRADGWATAPPRSGGAAAATSSTAERRTGAVAGREAVRMVGVIVGVVGVGSDGRRRRQDGGGCGGGGCSCHSRIDGRRRVGGRASSVQGRGGVRRGSGGGQLGAGKSAGRGGVGAGGDRPRTSSARSSGGLGRFFVRHVQILVQAKGKRRGERRVLWIESTGDRGANARLKSGPDRGSQTLSLN